MNRQMRMENLHALMHDLDLAWAVYRYTRQRYDFMRELAGSGQPGAGLVDLQQMDGLLVTMNLQLCRINEIQETGQRMMNAEVTHGENDQQHGGAAGG